MRGVASNSEGEFEVGRAESRPADVTSVEGARRRKLGQTKSGRALVFVGLLVLVFAPIALMYLVLKTTRDFVVGRIEVHPEETSLWASMPGLLFVAAAVVGIIAYRVRAYRDESRVLPQNALKPVRLAWFGIAVLFALSGIASFKMFQNSLPNSPADNNPVLWRSLYATTLGAVAVMAVLWLLAVCLPVLIRYLRVRGRAVAAHAVQHVGAGHDVRIVYRPSLTIGPPLAVSIDGAEPQWIGPAQVLGAHVGGGEVRLRLATGTTPGGKGVRAKEVTLPAQPGKTTHVTIVPGRWARLNVSEREGATQFAELGRAYTTPWSGVAQVGWPEERRVLREREREERRKAKESR